MKKIILNRSILLVVSIFLFSCKKPKISFDLAKQELIECSNYGLKDVTIENDSIDEKGFAVELPIILKWEGNTQTPLKISFNNVLKYYKITKDGNRLVSLKLMKNTCYKISYHIIGQQDTEIKVWTNKNGKIYKTTNENCDER